MRVNSKLKTQNSKLQKLSGLLLDWFSANARDLPWRRTRDPYAIWVSEIMLQQTQVKTVIPYWNRWIRELPTIRAVAQASPDKIHKLWEGLGYYTRARNLQKAARQIVARQNAKLKSRRRRGDESQMKKKSETPYVVSYKFPDNFDDVLVLPGIGRYTAGAICSIAFNQPVPILDGNVIRVLTRIFGIGGNPREKKTNARLWQLAEELVSHASRITYHISRPKSRTRTRTKDEDDSTCSNFNQSLMELGALVCTPRNPQCRICPAKRLCVAFRENRVAELPNLGKHIVTTTRRFIAFVVERDGKFLVRQRPAGVVNAHLWEFPNTEFNGASAKDAFKSLFGFRPPALKPLCTIKHSITRYRITLEAWRVASGGRSYTTPKYFRARRARPSEKIGIWKTPEQMQQLAFTAAHKKLASKAADCMLSAR
jgi:A/G-specific adenine glycosylase